MTSEEWEETDRDQSSTGRDSSGCGEKNEFEIGILYLFTSSLASWLHPDIARAPEEALLEPPLSCN